MNPIEILLSLLLIKNEPRIVSPIPDDGQVVLVSPKPVYYGQASWYSQVFDGINCDDKDCIMANGRPYNPSALTTACPTEFPLGTNFMVRYKTNSIKVVCTDRGAFKEKYGRALDLSSKAFSELAPLSQGIIWTEITPLLEEKDMVK